MTLVKYLQKVKPRGTAMPFPRMILKGDKEVRAILCIGIFASSRIQPQRCLEVFILNVQYLTIPFI
jgi:hypothetical protein